jgi:hypothetical protein
MRRRTRRGLARVVPTLVAVAVGVLVVVGLSGHF